jgi:hypothetical protein
MKDTAGVGGAYFKVLFKHLPGGLGQTLDRNAVSWSRFKPLSSRTQSMDAL